MRNKLYRLKTWQSVPPMFMLIYSIIDAASNIQFVLESYRRVELPIRSLIEPMWEVVKSGIGNLAFALIGTGWLAYLILRPEKTPTGLQKQSDSQALLTEQAKKPIINVPPKSIPQPSSQVPPLPGFPLLDLRVNLFFTTSSSSLFIEVENTGDKPLSCSFWVEFTKVWSEKRKRFVTYADSPTKFQLLPQSAILDPDTPIDIVLLKTSKVENKDFPFFNVRNEMIPIIRPGIHWLKLKIESEPDKREYGQDIFIEWEPTEGLKFTNDPRKQSSSN